LGDLSVTRQAIDSDVAEHRSTAYWAWCQLFDGAANASAIDHPDYVLAELNHRVTRHCDPAIVAYGRDNDWQDAAVLVPKTVNLKAAGAIGPSSRIDGYRLIGGHLLSRSLKSPENGLVDAILNVAREANASFVMLEDLDTESPDAAIVARALERGWLKIAPQGHQPRRRISLEGGEAAYWDKFSSKTRQTFRRKLKKCGPEELVRVTEISQVADFLSAAHEISLHTWQTRQFGLRVRNDDRELDLLTTLARLGTLRAYLWKMDGRPVAFCIGDQAKGVFNYQEVGYLSDCGRFSPGQMMLIRMLEDLLAHNPPRLFDFGGGDADYKQLFANLSSVSGTVLLLPPTWTSRALSAWLAGSRHVRQAARKIVESCGYATRARQWIRRGKSTSAATGEDGQSGSSESPNGLIAS
jgi:hypothetical protein